jgi:hypothetical protein
LVDYNIFGIFIIVFVSLNEFNERVKIVIFVRIIFVILQERFKVIISPVALREGSPFPASVQPFFVTVAGWSAIGFFANEAFLPVAVAVTATAVAASVSAFEATIATPEIATASANSVIAAIIAFINVILVAQVVVGEVGFL